MGFYDDMADTSNELLEEFGQTLSHSKKIDGTFDGISGTESGATTSAQSITAAVLPASSGKIQGLGKIFKEGMTYRERLFLLVSPKKPDGNALDFLPDPSTTITINSIVYTVAGFTEINPAGTSVLYKVGVYR